MHATTAQQAHTTIRHNDGNVDDDDDDDGGMRLCTRDCPGIHFAQCSLRLVHAHRAVLPSAEAAAAVSSSYTHTDKTVRRAPLPLPMTPMHLWLLLQVANNQQPSQNLSGIL